jgi:hypothetical protein
MDPLKLTEPTTMVSPRVGVSNATQSATKTVQHFQARAVGSWRCQQVSESCASCDRGFSAIFGILA